MYIPTMKVIGIVVSDKKIVNFSPQNYFSRCGIYIQRTGTILTIIEKSHIRIIPAKFGKSSQ